MGKLLLGRLFLHALFFGIAALAGFFMVYFVGLPAADGNPELVTGGANAFFVTYFVLIGLEFVIRQRRLSGDGFRRKVTAVIGITVLRGLVEIFASALSFLAAFLLEFYGFGHIAPETDPLLVGIGYLFFFLMIDVLMGVLLYLLFKSERGAEAEPSSAEAAASS